MEHSLEPSVKTVPDKSSPISKSLLMITYGEPSGLVRDYMHYILSPDGQKLVTKEGFVPLPRTIFFGWARRTKKYAHPGYHFVMKSMRPFISKIFII